VQDAGEPRHGGIQLRYLANRQAERERKHEADADGDPGQDQMLLHATGDIRQVVEGPVPQDQRLARPHATSTARGSASERNAIPSSSSVRMPAYRPRPST